MREQEMMSHNVRLYYRIPRGAIAEWMRASPGWHEAKTITA